MKKTGRNQEQKLRAIPTNIITGFLGVGKTTAIRHLLKSKPSHERWAVLVNEFGEVGVDGGLVHNETSPHKDIFVAEVPGGCMCCASGLPMQMALNLLLKRARPHRLLIEPTGLGHPLEVVSVLSTKYYQDVLDINSTITLVDARKLSDKKYTSNRTFNQQLDIADVIVANKADLYTSEDFRTLIDHLRERFGEKCRPLFPVRHGTLDISWLKGPASSATKSGKERATAEPPSAMQRREEFEFPSAGYLSIANNGEGYHSLGWVFKSDFVFDREKLNSVMLSIHADRAKGVFITHQGIVGFNKVDDVLTEIALDDSLDSRVEIISKHPSSFNGVEQQLLSCAL